MIDDDVAWSLVAAAGEEVNQQLPSSDRLPIDRSTVLLGPGGSLGSLSLISLVLALETMIAERTGQTVIVFKEEYLADHDSPLQTFGTLTEHVRSLLG